MRIDGQWAVFADGFMRPIIRGEIRGGDDSWIEVPFLVDTGADRTLFSADTRDWRQSHLPRGRGLFENVLTFSYSRCRIRFGV